MTVFIDGKRINEVSLAGVSLSDVLCFARHDEMEETLAALRQERLLRLESAGSPGTRFESHDDFDYLHVAVPDFDDPYEAPRAAELFLFRDKLLVFSDGSPAADKVLQAAQAGGAIPPEKALYLFFAHLLESDHQELLEIEEQIIDLEDELLDKPPDYTQKISWLRRRLFQLKRYYGGLYDLFDELEENRNNMLSREQLHAFHRHTGRAARLCQEVHNLHDYVTHVREAYQAQTDIELNKTTRVFTVIASIFLPLTLLAGWYGMNLPMPEIDMRYTYPAVIGAAVAIAGGCILLFRRKKWF